MIFVENNNMDPYVNHALEEWLMENYDDDCFMLWRNEKALLLGRNQNVRSEINLEAAKEHGVKIVRRITGGGTVYTDDGTIMFTFICGSGRGFADFKHFSEPVVSAVRSLGINAEFSGRNDLTIDGMKFSGNAQCTYQGKLLHHGTLMYSTDIGAMAELLRVNKLKLQDKGVSSVKSRVTNISDFMDTPMDIEKFRSYLFNKVMESDKNAVFLRLTDNQWNKVREKAKEKHALHQWIYGQSPEFNIKKEAKFTGGMVQVYLNEKGGRIESASIFGDFFGDRDISVLENVLSGVSYTREAINEALSNVSFNEYLHNISLDEFISAIL
ncbi:MAG: lipoate--protein ligase [Clostridiales bacterium]|jgi:lipoate-protein ligase A|nr:lipoate--protein ligase [Clostridiales bacterium]